MFKKIFALLALAVFVISLLGGCAPTTGPENGDGNGEGTVEGDRVIKIGSSSSMTGPMAAFGAGEIYGQQAAIEDINAQGGVYIEEYGKKLLVEHVYLDNESDPAICASTAADLILRYEVDGLAGGGSPPTSYNPICTQCDRYQTPIVTGGPFEPWWDGGPYEYAWNIEFNIATPVTAGDPREGLPGYSMADAFLSLTNKVANETNGKVGVLAADDADGRGWYAIFPGFVEEAGLTPIGKDEQLGLFPPGTTDFGPIIERWKQEDAQILWGNLPGSDLANFLRQMDRMDFKPKIMIMARAAMFYEEVEAFPGDWPHGLCTDIFWHPSFPSETCPGIGDTTAATLTERWTAASGNPLNMNIGFGYGCVQVLLAAMEKAGTLDKEAVNKAISEIETDTIVGFVKFDHQNNSPSPVNVGQWIEVEPGKYELKVVHTDHEWLKSEADELLFPIP